MECQQRVNDSWESYVDVVAACQSPGVKQVLFVFISLQTAESPAVSAHFKEAISPSAGTVQRWNELSLEGVG